VDLESTLMLEYVFCQRYCWRCDMSLDL